MDIETVETELKPTRTTRTTRGHEAIAGAELRLPAHAPPSRLHNSQRWYRFCYILFIVSAVLAVASVAAAAAAVAAAVATLVGASAAAAPTAPWAVNGTCVLHILRQVEVDGMAMFSLRNKSRVLNLNSSQWATMAEEVGWGCQGEVWSGCKCLRTGTCCSFPHPLAQQRNYVKI